MGYHALHCIYIPLIIIMYIYICMITYAYVYININTWVIMRYIVYTFHES